MKRITAALATAALVLSAGIATAATVVNVTDITGVWQNVTGSAVSGENTDTISWGGGSDKSSYVFAAAPTAFVATSPFTLGDFTHNNNPISPPSITGAQLKVTVAGNVVVDGGVASAFSMGGVYSFTHLETPNNDDPCPNGGTGSCPDLVTFNGALSFFGDDLVVDGVHVVLGINGFAAGTSFLTLERQANTAALTASFTATPLISTVPLPASALLLLAGIGGLGGLRSRKNKKA